MEDVGAENPVQGRGCRCPACGAHDLSITADSRGVLGVWCHACSDLNQAGVIIGLKRDGVRLTSFKDEGPLCLASRKVLTWLCKLEQGGEWIDAPWRRIVAECRISRRDIKPSLKDLCRRNLIKVQLGNRVNASRFRLLGGACRYNAMAR